MGPAAQVPLRAPKTPDPHAVQLLKRTNERKLAEWANGLAGTVIERTRVPGIGFHFPGPVALAVAAAAVVMGVTAAIIPARRAARLKVITALTYE